MALQLPGRATNYTHHQKSVLLDTASGGEGSPRRVTAYIGGIDLTSGRYDNAEHSLFGTLGTVHSEDYYQNCIPGCVQDCGGERGVQLYFPGASWSRVGFISAVLNVLLRLLM